MPAESSPAPAPAPASVPGGTDYRDAFRVVKSGTYAKRDEDNPPGRMFRAAVEAERWRSKLSAEPRGGRADGMCGLMLCDKMWAVM